MAFRKFRELGDHSTDQISDDPADYDLTYVPPANDSSTDSAASTAAHAAAAAALMSEKNTVLDKGLTALASGQGFATASVALNGGLSMSVAGALSPDGQFVTIDATAIDGDGAALLANLQAIGLQGGASFHAVVSGWLPVSAVSALLNVENLAHASESAFITHAGLTTAQGDVSMHADSARSTYGVDGFGLKVGVLSDSFDTKAAATTHMAQDFANGDLPFDTTILQDSPGGTDEGRGMAQIIHDSAPSASILFATANGGQANFANNILALANAGARVIVDDVSYFAEPMFQDGVIAQAVNQVVASGAVWISALPPKADTLARI